MSTAKELESTNRFIINRIPDWKPEHTLQSSEIEEAIKMMMENNEIASERFTYQTT